MIQDSIVNKLNELENESYTIAGNITKIIPNNIDTRKWHFNQAHIK